jgi:hypothetical protein
MKLYAFAALMALPLLGLGAQSASADYYCCGQQKHHYQHKKLYYVVKDSTVFDCDAYHCETKIKVFGGSTIKADCRDYGWCEIKGLPFGKMWVVEACLKPAYSEGEYSSRGDYEQDDEQR